MGAMSKLGRFIEAEKVDVDDLLAEIEAEGCDHCAEIEPMPQSIEAFCQKCDGLNLPCLYRQTWKSDDGLVRHCPELRRVYGGE
jgi:hypothetical protein